MSLIDCFTSMNVSLDHLPTDDYNFMPFILTRHDRNIKLAHNLFEKKTMTNINKTNFQYSLL